MTRVSATGGCSDFRRVCKSAFLFPEWTKGSWNRARLFSQRIGGVPLAGRKRYHTRYGAGSRQSPAAFGRRARNGRDRKGRNGDRCGHHRACERRGRRLISRRSGGGPARIGDPVYRGDVVQTGANGKVGITFTDGAAFNLSSNARMVLNEFVYDPNGTSNSTLFSLTKGTFTFIAGKVATGGMKIDTPVATMKFRGTTPTWESPVTEPSDLPILLKRTRPR